MPRTKTTPAEQPAQSAPGRIEYREFLPSELVVDPFNHRQGNMAPPSKELKDSVSLVGVKEAVGVRLQADGTFGVYKGRRRLLAAQEAAAKAKAKGVEEKALPRIPALVHHDLTDVDDETLLLSLLENQFRENATKADELHVAEQLALMDVPEERRRRHAKTLGVPLAQLKAAKGAAQLSEEAKSRALAEDFDWIEMDQWQRVGGGKDTFDRLSRAKGRDQRSGKPGNGEWRQELQRVKDEQAEMAKLDAVKEELRATGVKVVQYSWGWSGTDARPLTHLLTSLGKAMTVEIHAQVCPSHGVAVNPDTLAPVYVCTSWHAEGHRLTEEYAEKLAKSGNAPVDPEAEKAKAKAKREGTAAWRSARTVRLEMLRAAIADKNLPEAAEELTERTVMGRKTWWFKSVASARTEVAAALLGIPDPNEGRDQWRRLEDPFEELIAKGPKSRRKHRMFARVAAAIETHVMADKEWQEPTEDMVTYLRILEKEFGYVLAECERQAIADFERRAALKDTDAGSESTSGDTEAGEAEAQPGMTDDQGDGAVAGEDGTGGEDQAGTQPGPGGAAGEVAEDRVEAATEQPAGDGPAQG
ncbi:hypothetical protein ACFRKE_23575 [Kitasatospora indigofera]|uniref:hypothetical protein n=1 Tax=Kitasatospora indigofera TaxID=67307 RepID=UPI0036AB30A3